jgi:nicotinate-nucleotide adenylyltransferase
VDRLVRRLGILGGTFDPPHTGHLILAEYAYDALDLEQVLFVPAADPPHKQQEDKQPVKHRLVMLELALTENDHFAISRVDVDRPGPHYSVDMLQIVQAQYPDHELYFVMGSDSLRNLVHWYRPDEFIQRCHLAVMRRPGDYIQLNMHDAALPGLSERVVMVEAPLIGIASSQIVERIQHGRSIRYLLPQSVVDYIDEHRLYRA